MAIRARGRRDDRPPPDRSHDFGLFDHRHGIVVADLTAAYSVLPETTTSASRARLVEMTSKVARSGRRRQRKNISRAEAPSPPSFPEPNPWTTSPPPPPSYGTAAPAAISRPTRSRPILRILGDLRRYLADGAHASPATASGLTAYAEWLIGPRNLAPATVKRRLACLRALFASAERRGDIAASSFRTAVGRIRLPKCLPRCLTVAELRR
jgi:hypothetical protein